MSSKTNGSVKKNQSVKRSKMFIILSSKPNSLVITMYIIKTGYIGRKAVGL
jgi:hypothetical protein